MRRVRRSRHRRLSLLYNQPGLVSRVCAVMSRHELPPRVCALYDPFVIVFRLARRYASLLVLLLVMPSHAQSVLVYPTPRNSLLVLSFEILASFSSRCYPDYLSKNLPSSRVPIPCHAPFHIPSSLPSALLPLFHRRVSYHVAFSFRRRPLYRDPTSFPTIPYASLHPYLLCFPCALPSTLCPLLSNGNGPRLARQHRFFSKPLGLARVAVVLCFFFGNCWNNRNE